MGPHDPSITMALQNPVINHSFVTLKDNSRTWNISCDAGDFTKFHKTDTKKTQSQDNNLWIAYIVELATLGTVGSSVTSA